MSEYVEIPRGECFGEFVLIKTIIYEKTYKSNARSAMFFGSFCHKRNRGFTGAVPPLLCAKRSYSVRSTANIKKR